MISPNILGNDGITCRCETAIKGCNNLDAIKYSYFWYEKCRQSTNFITAERWKVSWQFEKIFLIAWYFLLATFVSRLIPRVIQLLSTFLTGSCIINVQFFMTIFVGKESDNRFSSSHKRFVDNFYVKLYAREYFNRFQKIAKGMSQSFFNMVATNWKLVWQNLRIHSSLKHSCIFIFVYLSCFE